MRTRQELALKYMRAVFPSLLRAASSVDEWRHRELTSPGDRGSERDLKPFTEFHVRCAAAVRRLSAAIAWAAAPGGLESYPYADVVDPLRVEETAQRFWAAWRRFERLGDSSLLFRTLESADVALPRLNKLSRIINQSQSSRGDSSRGRVRAFVESIDELPVQVDLPDHLKTHSVIVCPVSRQQCTPSDPPMVLSCSHVVSRSSLDRLRHGSGPIRCPVCHSSGFASDATELKVRF
jgi:hypothetical protein